MLHVRNPKTDLPIQDMEDEEEEEDEEGEEVIMAPDWSLISLQGLMASLQMCTSMFTRVGFAWEDPFIHLAAPKGLPNHWYFTEEELSVFN